MNETIKGITSLSYFRNISTKGIKKQRDENQKTKHVVQTYISNILRN